MKMTIAQNMINIMKQHGRTNIWYGDIDLIEKCAIQSNIPSKHPQKRIQHILNALDNSPHFSKSYIFADINGRTKKYRCFTLKS